MEIELELKRIEMKEKENIIELEKEKTKQIELSNKDKEEKIELKDKEIQLSMLKDTENKIKYYGVTKSKDWHGNPNYLARISHNGKQIYLGAYDTPEKASYACNCKRTFLNHEIDKISNIDYSKIYTFDNTKDRLVLNK
jgi:hypothetical protein